MIRFAVIDIETTGEAPPAEILEVGVSAARIDGSSYMVEDPMDRLFKPLRGIPPAARAVHHIGPTDVQHAVPCTALDLAMAVAIGGPDAILVAHNAAFEQLWFTPEVTAKSAWICTYKVALRVFPEAPAFGNQALRYFFEDEGLMPNLKRELCEPSHRAGPDAFVTAYVLGVLLQRASLEQMIEWTKEPRLMPKITFGKHKGAAWSEPPYDYLRWLIDKSDMDADTKWNAQRELNARQRRAH